MVLLAVSVPSKTALRRIGYALFLDLTKQNKIIKIETIFTFSEYLWYNMYKIYCYIRKGIFYVKI